MAVTAKKYEKSVTIIALAEKSGANGPYVSCKIGGGPRDWVNCFDEGCCDVLRTAKGQRVTVELTPSKKEDEKVPGQPAYWYISDVKSPGGSGGQGPAAGADEGLDTSPAGGDGRSHPATGVTHHVRQGNGPGGAGTGAPSAGQTEIPINGGTMVLTKAAADLRADALLATCQLAAAYAYRGKEKEFSFHAVYATFEDLLVRDARNKIDETFLSGFFMPKAGS